MKHQEYFEIPFSTIIITIIRLAAQYMREFKVDTITFTDLKNYRVKKEGIVFAVKEADYKILHKYGLMDITEGKHSSGRFTKKAWRINQNLWFEVDDLLSSMDYFGSKDRDQKIIKILSWANARKNMFTYANAQAFLVRNEIKHKFTPSIWIWYREAPLFNVFHKEKSNNSYYGVTETGARYVETWKRIQVLIEENTRVLPVESVYAQYYRDSQHAKNKTLPTSVVSIIQKSAENVRTLH